MFSDDDAGQLTFFELPPPTAAESIALGIAKVVTKALAKADPPAAAEHGQLAVATDVALVGFRFGGALMAKLEAERAKGRRVLVMGDFKTAHREIDLVRPKSNKKTRGFLVEEREELDRWIEAGWVDTFRSFEDGPDHQIWGSQRFGAREKNIGWRIDQVFACPAAMKFVKSAFILPTVKGSDQRPAGDGLDSSITGAR